MNSTIQKMVEIYWGNTSMFCLNFWIKTIHAMIIWKWEVLGKSLKQQTVSHDNITAQKVSVGLISAKQNGLISFYIFSNYYLIVSDEMRGCF